MARNRYYEDEDLYAFKGHYIARLLSYVLPYKVKLAKGVCVMLLISGLTTSLPYISGLFVDWIFPKFTFTTKDPFTLGLGMPDYYISIYTKLALVLTMLFGLVYVLIAILSTLRGLLLNYVGQYAIYDLRKDIFSHLQKLSFKYYDSRPAGKILVRVTSYVDALSDLLSSGIVSLISDSMIVIVLMLVMILINAKLSLVSFCAIIPLVTVSYIFKKVMRDKWRNLRNAASNRTAYIHENIMGLYITQAFNREKTNFNEYQRLNTNIKDIWVNLCLTNHLIGPAVEFINTACTAAIYIIGYSLLTKNNLSPGNLLSFILYIPMFWGPINNIVNQFNQVVTAMSNIERIFETIDTEPDIKDSPDAVEMPQITGNIRFEKVSFDYGDSNKILEDVSFDIPAGSNIALVGPTGAGKTTVVNLLPRFYDVTDGKVLIDNIDVRDVQLDTLRKQIGVMMQDSFIFSGTVMDNIRYGNETATDEECIHAAKTVFAHDFISRMKDGYNTELGERGAGLSAGEKQLISFARTILINPRILILDEATASIDTDTEIIIQKALAVLLKGRTSFIIAHRLSTIKKADRIMYVANKGIAESGSHEELIASKGKYYELCISQHRAV